MNVVNFNVGDAYEVRITSNNLCHHPEGFLKYAIQQMVTLIREAQSGIFASFVQRWSHQHVPRQLFADSIHDDDRNRFRIGG